MLLAGGIEMWTRSFKFWTLTFGDGVDMNRVFTRRKILHLEHDPDALPGGRNLRRADAFALTIFQLHRYRILSISVRPQHGYPRCHY
jgi:hypothetical protein